MCESVLLDCCNWYCLLWFIDAALMQFLEKEIQPFQFHTWTYYIWVTIATVGYGDITPKTPLGRLVLV